MVAYDAYGLSHFGFGASVAWESMVFHVSPDPPQKQYQRISIGYFMDEGSFTSFVLEYIMDARFSPRVILHIMATLVSKT